MLRLKGGAFFYVQTLSGKRIMMNMEGDEKVKAVRKAIERVMGVPCEEQKLTFQGSYLKDEHTFNQYGIMSGSTIHLSSLITSYDLRVRFGKQFRKLEFHGGGQPLSRVVEEVAQEFKLSKEIVRLCFQGKVLDPDYSLNDYAIPRLASLQLELVSRPIHFNLHLISGNVTFEIDLEFSLLQVKALLIKTAASLANKEVGQVELAREVEEGKYELLPNRDRLYSHYRGSDTTLCVLLN